MGGVIAFSEIEKAAARPKRAFHPLLAFADRPEVAGGEALAGLLCRENAGFNTAVDHVQVLDMPLAAPRSPWSPTTSADCPPAALPWYENATPDQV